jgi:hypothetical protein
MVNSLRGSVCLLALFAACGPSRAVFDASEGLSARPGDTVTTKVKLRTTLFARGPYTFAASTELPLTVTISVHPENTGVPNVADTRGGIESAEVTIDVDVPDDVALGTEGTIELTAVRRDGPDHAEVSIPIRIE